MGRLKLFMVVTTGLCIVGLSAMVMAGEPEAAKTLKVKETIDIDLIPGKKGAVKFPHDKHHQEYKSADDKAIVCKTCHHKLEVDIPEKVEGTKKCSDCHTLDGSKVIDGAKAPAFAEMKGEKVSIKSVLFHKRCRPCHKAHQAKMPDSKLNKCPKCHIKKK